MAILSSVVGVAGFVIGLGAGGIPGAVLGLFCGVMLTLCTWPLVVMVGYDRRHRIAMAHAEIALAERDPLFRFALHLSRAARSLDFIMESYRAWEERCTAGLEPATDERRAQFHRILTLVVEQVERANAQFWALERTQALSRKSADHTLDACAEALAAFGIEHDVSLDALTPRIEFSVPDASVIEHALKAVAELRREGFTLVRLPEHT